MQRGRWRFLGQRHDLVLTRRGDVGARGDALSARDGQRALDAALHGATSSIAARTLAECACSMRTSHGRAVPFARDDARAVVREALSRSLLVAWRVRNERVTAALPDMLDSDALERLPLASALLAKTWIEIELTDMEGEPQAGRRYWIKLTDGRVREGALDQNGRAYFGDLDPGDCEIRWPELDDEATVAAPPVLNATPPERTWVEIELTDMEGGPVPHQRYSVTLPDGAVREGTLDRHGLARFEQLVPGTCLVRWPDLDDEAAIAALDPTVAQPEDPPLPRHEAPSAGPRTPRGSTRLSAEAIAQAEAQAATLISAAREGVPFCEECERARRARLGAAATTRGTA